MLVDAFDRTINAFISPYISDECRAGVERVHRNTGVDLLPALKGFLSSPSVRMVADSGNAGDERLLCVNAKDRPIVATALNQGLVVCTNDVEDYRKASVLGLEILTPAELANGGTVGLHTVFRLSLLNAQRGAIYAQFHPNWADAEFSRHASERFSLLDQVGLGCLYYRASNQSFCFDGDIIPSVSIRVGKIRADQLPAKLVFSYDEAQGVRLVFGLEGPFAEHNAKWRGQGAHLGATSLGNDRDGKNQLNGAISILSTFPAPLTLKATRRLIKGVTVPDPEERQSLEEIARKFYS